MYRYTSKRISTILFVRVLFFATFIQATKLPHYFTRCKLDSPEVNKCILDNANAHIHTFSKGDNTYHIQSSRPIRSPFINININGGLIINITDAVIEGFDQLNFTDVKVDFDKKIFFFEMNTPFVRITGDYSVAGRILLLPITGNGLLNTTFVQPKFKYSFEYNLKENRNKQYIEPRNTKMTYEAERVYYQLDNLFNGNKLLGEQMNKFLNENWKDVDAELGAKLGETAGKLLTLILENFFAKVALSELFET